MLKDVLNVAIAVFFFALSGFLVCFAALVFWLVAPPRPAMPGEATPVPYLEPTGEPPLYLEPGPSPAHGDAR